MDLEVGEVAKKNQFFFVASTSIFHPDSIVLSSLQLSKFLVRRDPFFSLQANALRHELEPDCIVLVERR